MLFCQHLDVHWTSKCWQNNWAQQSDNAGRFVDECPNYTSDWKVRCCQYFCTRWQKFQSYSDLVHHTQIWLMNHIISIYGIYTKSTPKMLVKLCPSAITSDFGSVSGIYIHCCCAKDKSHHDILLVKRQIYENFKICKDPFPRKSAALTWIKIVYIFERKRFQRHAHFWIKKVLLTTLLDV